MAGEEKCPVCDRTEADCGRFRRMPWARISDAVDANPHGSLASAVYDCHEHAVAWRTRALAAEQRFDLAAFADAKAAWSRETFGPGDRYAGVIAHIRKELDEIAEEPSSLTEWVDVVLLAMDGAWRSARADGAALVAEMIRKDRENRGRTWPDWRTLKEGEVAERVREAPDVPDRSCNKHDDCAAADRDADALGKKRPYHCHSEDCEECFGC